MKRNAFRKGVTLIEVLVASVILAITVAAVMSMLAQNKRGIDDSYYANQALEIIQERFEQIQHRSDRNLIKSAFSDKYTFSNPEKIMCYTPDNKVIADFYNLYYTSKEVGYVSVPNCKVLEISANVSWNRNGKTSNLVLSTRTRQ